MDVAAVMGIAREAVTITLMCAMPMLMAALVTGLLISIGQAATQVNEATLSFVPKIMAVFGVLLAGGVWILDQLVTFTIRLFDQIPLLVGP
ncbi:MAG: flagellar biosynthetic protein FliQ [Myxococcales bacterium]|nr:flagellar biosynthetic protein FliQ [Myxococcales bacterium]